MDSVVLRSGSAWDADASILLGLMSLLLIYGTSRLLFPDDPILTAVATGIAALLPTHIAITSTVNNDVLLECCFSASPLSLAQCLLRGLTLWRAGWIGLVLGVALLTKATALLLIPVIVLGLIFLKRSGSRGERTEGRGLDWDVGAAFERMVVRSQSAVVR